MRRFVRWFIAILAATAVALGAVVAISVVWNDRAEDVCREEAPQSAGEASASWEWSEFAYVCDRRGVEEGKRVGLVDAFHGEGRRPHR